MPLAKTLVAALVAIPMATASFAGGFADEIVETPVAPVQIVEPAAPRGSLPGWVIPAVLVAGLVALAVSGDDSDDEDDAS
ncbi:hypothetical protein [Wenxinia marina]|uniref:Uncharacterized protein n=1 Tax=Wenxinia marina DSM 24838 TaxID=1123501 RepID=A0A0D0QDH0_9RHOB|nr:hypothetical protein [Wenxinia marina]KIQ70377.1 hypothetical protein Wenmar_00753 [Wenxinia marina DSM 24838]GGL53655.1 hypothetical protein GCM10011392_05000 [Wenxinia marina]